MLYSSLFGSLCLFESQSMHSIPVGFFQAFFHAIKDGQLQACEQIKEPVVLYTMLLNHVAQVALEEA